VTGITEIRQFRVTVAANNWAFALCRNIYMRLTLEVQLNLQSTCLSKRVYTCPKIMC
jgi:hypothetical protein